MTPIQRLHFTAEHTLPTYPVGTIAELRAHPLGLEGLLCTLELSASPKDLAPMRRELETLPDEASIARLAQGDSLLARRLRPFTSGPWQLPRLKVMLYGPSQERAKLLYPDLHLTPGELQALQRAWEDSLAGAVCLLEFRPNPERSQHLNLASVALITVCGA